MTMIPARRTQFTDSRKFTAGATVRAGVPIILQATDTYGSQEKPDVIEAANNTVNIIGIPRGEPGTSYAAGAEFDAWVISSTVLHVRVGTGGATRGSRAAQSGSGDGLTDLPAFGTATRIYSPGIFLGGGVVGDWVALLVDNVSTSKA